jgi:hypothetical protein
MLIVGCVLVGLGAQVLRITVGGAICPHSKVTCCENHLAEMPLDDHDNDDGGPCEHHHHHGCCSHPLPLTLDTTLVYRLGIPGGSLLAIRHESEITPEGPFLSSDKPPLI